MSKLSFRARALDTARPMAVYLAEELPDLPDHSAISRAVPAMPTGMEKDEECEHHLQRAICAGMIIPTPEVLDLSDFATYDRLYPQTYSKPRQLIHMQPLGLEQEVPDYDMDSEDERWLKRQHAATGGRASELTELKFEETMEKLERGSGQTVVTLREARALAGKTGLPDHILAAVYDYWLNKRLATQQPLLLAVRTEPRPGAPQASPYLAFRRRTEKMQTRKNRKNDESSYEKMVKLRRELSDVVSLLDLVRQREQWKRDGVKMTSTIVEKQYIARDFSGMLVAEATAARATVVPTMLASQFSSHHRAPLDAAARQRDKRQYKRRKHRHHSPIDHVVQMSGSSSSSEGEGMENGTLPAPESPGAFTFRRKPGCLYHMPTSFDLSDDVPWMMESIKENTHPGRQDPKFKYVLASLDNPKPRCLGFVRRRIGRGGRVILDRLSCPANEDRLWESLGYTMIDSKNLRPSNEEVSPSCDARFSHSSMPSAVDSLSNKIECETSRSSHSVDQSVRLSDSVFDELKVKSELDNNKLYRERADRVLSTSNSLPDDLMDVNIKTEIDDISFNAADVLSLSCNLSVKDQVSNTECIDGSSDSDSLSSCDGHNYFNSKFSFKGSTLDKGQVFKRYRDRNSRLRNARKVSSKTYHEDTKVINELLVAQKLAQHEQRVPDMSSPQIDSFLKDVWGDRLHFKPKQADSEAKATSKIMHQDDIEQLNEHSSITVTVRLALPDAHQPPSELLFTDTSPFVTSEFSLADIYGDSIINPNPDVEMTSDEDHSKLGPNKDASWIHTNGPVKLFKKSEDDKPDASSPSKTVLKSEPSESTNSNQTGVFLLSDGDPASGRSASINSDSIIFSVDDSNHEVTNGVVSEWNDSNESAKLKLAQKKNASSLTLKSKSAINSIDTIGNSIIVKSDAFSNSPKVFVDSDRSMSPSVSQTRSVPSNQPQILSIEKSDQKKIEVQNQNLSIVQLKTSVLPQSKVFKSVLTGDGTEVRTPLLVAQSRQSGSPVRKADVRIRGADDNTISVGGQQQLVTLAMPDSFRVRMPGNAGSGTATISSHDFLGLVQHKTIPSTAISKDGVAGSPRHAVLQMASGAGRAVRLLQTKALSTTQRTKLLTPASSLQIKGLANLIQLQVRNQHRRTETLESTQQPVEAASAGSATAGTGGDAGPAPSGPAAAAGPPPAPGKPPPPSPRKGQASLPMEVT